MRADIEARLDRLAAPDPGPPDADGLYAKGNPLTGKPVPRDVLARYKAELRRLSASRPPAAPLSFGDAATLRWLAEQPARDSVAWFPVDELTEPALMRMLLEYAHAKGIALPEAGKQRLAAIEKLRRQLERDAHVVKSRGPDKHPDHHSMLAAVEARLGPPPWPRERVLGLGPEIIPLFSRHGLDYYRKVTAPHCLGLRPRP